jgi:P-type Ca2+ transporter type 2C
MHNQLEWYRVSNEDVIAELDTSLSFGLESAEATKRLQMYGLNRMQSKREKTAFEILLAQFISPVIYMLVAAAVISFILADTPEGIAIIIVIFINAAIGFYMEWQALTTMKALKKMDVIEAKVIRDGSLQQISSDEITIGDLIKIEAGDIIPADARIIDLNQLQVDESALTGESLPVSKTHETLHEEYALAEQVNMLFKGTIAVGGNAKGVVVRIGMETELGNISEMVRQADQSATPLEKKLGVLTKKLVWVTIAIAGIYVVVGILKKQPVFNLLETSIAMAVAAIPEGLPIVATIALAYGMLKMARKNVLVKHLAAVETLGSANIILTDKTGTLTENKITTTAVVTSKQVYINMNEAIQDPAIDKILFIAALCNDADINQEKQIGDPLEIALLKWAEKKQYATRQIRETYKRVDEEAFSSEAKYMTTYHEHDQKYYSCTKGAAEVLLNKCKFYFDDNEERQLDEAANDYWLQQANQLAENGIRVLGFAYAISGEMNFSGEDLIFAGLVGFNDPPNEKVASAIDQCHAAGIKVVMLTGDHAATALHIARQINLVQGNEHVLHGKQLAALNLSDVNEREKLLNTTVFARITPRQKLDLVQMFQQFGYVAAMTGDGVNDAPALKKADIGIAMGLRGTQIAKETADIVLKDDSFISIVMAVQQGRIIFENIRKCILFLLSCNVSEILVISISAFLSLSSPLSPLQILYLNLITDVFPALALSVSKGNRAIMRRPPRDTKEGILVASDWRSVFIYATFITLSIFGGYIYCHNYLRLDEMICNNVVFVSLALAQLWHVFNLSSADVSFFKNEITGNKYIWWGLLGCIVIMIATYFITPVREVLSVKELNAQALLIILITSLLPVLFIQLLKRAKIIASL